MGITRNSRRPAKLQLLHDIGLHPKTPQNCQRDNPDVKISFTTEIPRRNKNEERIKNPWSSRSEEPVPHVIEGEEGSVVWTRISEVPTGKEGKQAVWRQVDVTEVRIPRSLLVGSEAAAESERSDRQAQSDGSGSGAGAPAKGRKRAWGSESSDAVVDKKIVKKQK